MSSELGSGLGEDGRTTVLLRTHDTLRARMIAELLEGEGIPVATPGLEHRSMLGMAGAYIEVVLVVPSTDLERARELVAALDASIEDGAEDDEGGEDGAEDDEPRARAERDEPTPEPKLKRIAAFAALVFPFGGGHMYVRRFATAGLLAVLQIASWIAMVVGVPAAFLLLPLVVAADYLGAAWHCDRIAANASAPERGGWRRFAVPAAAAVVIAWCALGSGPGAALIAGSDARTICRAYVECLDVRGGEDECVLRAAQDRLDDRVWPESCAPCIARSETCEDVYACHSACD